MRRAQKTIVGVLLAGASIARRMAVGAGCVCCGTLLLGLVLAAPACGEPRSSPPEMLDDAALAGLFFLDADRGWAVGDRGVIWSTDDGGRHWRLADSPVNSRLESVHFVDPDHGWAVGGWIHPYTHQSTAVVVRTETGGRRWQRVASPTLPGLKGVHFVDARRGWAVGHASPMYGSGVFRSDDGGRSWTAIPSPQPLGWLCGTFRDLEGGVLGGLNGATAVVARGEIQATQPPPPGWLPFRDVACSGSLGWLVGDGGIVLRTSDGGHSWERPVAAMPEELAESFDWRCVAMVGERCWIAGAPGSAVLHTEDGGRSWQLLPTSQNLPLRDLFFLDEQRGWAVGRWVTILATRDGGRTWQLQKGRRTRAAVLALYSEPDRIPVELLTRLSGDEGYIGVVEVFARRDIEAAAVSPVSWEERTQAAVVAAGGSQADASWQFPVRQAGLDLPGEAIVTGWNTLHADRAASLLEQHVVRCIRQWRPDLILTENASPRGEEPLAHLINQVVLNAVRSAADGASYPGQVAAGLGPWKATKVYAAAHDPAAGNVRLETARLATRLGSSVSDYAAEPRGLLNRRWTPPPATLSFQLLLSELPNPSGDRDFFSGLAVPVGGDARREAGGPAGSTTIESLNRLAQKQRNLQSLISRSSDASFGGAGWLAQVEELTRGLSPSAAGEILYQLAQQYRQAGQPELAADALNLLVRRFPDHGLAEAALLWLVQYHASSEVETYRGQAAVGSVQYLATRLPEVVPDSPAATSGDSPSPATAEGERPAAPDGPSSLQARAIANPRANRLAELGQLIQQSRPALYLEPQIQFALAAAARRGGVADSAAAYETLLRSTLPPAWQRCREANSGWLTTGDSHPNPCSSASPPTSGRVSMAAWMTPFGSKPLRRS